jgi:hypothetical protein
MREAELAIQRDERQGVLHRWKMLMLETDRERLEYGLKRRGVRNRHWQYIDSTGRTFIVEFHSQSARKEPQVMVTGVGATPWEAVEIAVMPEHITPMCPLAEFYLKTYARLLTIDNDIEAYTNQIAAMGKHYNELLTKALESAGTRVHPDIKSLIEGRVIREQDSLLADISLSIRKLTCERDYLHKGCEAPVLYFDALG